MSKMITIVFIFLMLLLATPIYAASSFQYTRLIQTDNLKGYKFVVLDKAVYAHSDHLNDLRVINDKDEEVPYILTSILDASTEAERKSFILAQDVEFSTTQDRTDTIITMQVDNLNAFRLELNSNDMIGRTYGLFGLKDASTHYLSDGEIFNRLHSDSPVKQDIEWTNNPPIDKLKLIIHNRDSKPIILKSIKVKYYLTKLVYMDLGSSQYRLAYGNNTLRFPIYDVPINKANINKEVITQSTLGAEISVPPITDTPKIPSNPKLLFVIPPSVVILILVLGLRRKINK